MELNVILRGQSNAQLFAYFNGTGQMQDALQKHLGFDGVTNKVNIIADWSSPNGHNTINSSTSFLTDWMQGTQPGALEQGLLSRIGDMSAAGKANPTVILWMHNEYDSQIGGLTSDQWTSAVRADAAMVRQALGQTAATTPYVFANVPYPYESSDPAIKLGMQQLSEDPSFNARIGAQIADLNMNGWNPSGGSHMGQEDAAVIAPRLAASLAEAFAEYALPGSRAALGQIDAFGPEVVKADLVAGHSNQVLMTVALDHAAGVTSADAVAQAGVAWTAGSHKGIAAEIVDSTHVKVTFDGALSNGDVVSYAHGSNRPAASFDNNAIGHGIYDNNGMPLFTDYDGVVIGAAAEEPSSVRQNGVAAAGATVAAPAPTPTAAQPVTPPSSHAPASLFAGTGSDGLVLKVSQDYYQGDAQYTVSVDGVQVGGTFSASALHGQASDILHVYGNWDAGDHQVSVTFLNDLYGGSAGADRNLYVDGATFTGPAVTGAAHSLYSNGTISFTATKAAASSPTTPPVAEPGTGATMPAAGTTTPAGSHAPATLEAGSGADTLVLKVSEQYYAHDAQYTVTVDGQQVGGTFAVSALHGQGADTLTLHGDWGAGQHTVQVNFTNDAYDTAADWSKPVTADLNMFVESATFNGAAVGGAALDLYNGNSANTFTVTGSAPPTSPPTTTPTPTPAPIPTGTDAHAPATVDLGTGSSSLVLHISQDAWQGDAQYVVIVDGQQVGEVLTASALHGSNQSDTVTIHGDFGSGTHTVELNFLNDACDWAITDWSVPQANDRNLHLDGATVNGQAIAGSTLDINSAVDVHSFTFITAAPPVTSPTPVPAPTPATQNLARITNGDGADHLTFNGLHGAVISDGKGQDVITLGTNHSKVHFAFHPGEADGDSIIGFVGHSHGGTDVLDFYGFHAGTQVTALGNGDFKVANETFHLDGVQSLGAGDYAFH